MVLGALLMSAGHLAMSFDQSFLIALALLIVGSGCLKGNISAQVGQLYPSDEEIAARAGFTIFSAAINIGAVLGPLACGARGRGVWLARRLRAGGGADARSRSSFISSGQRHLPEASRSAPRRARRCRR